MMLGTAAKSSTAVDTGCFSHPGDSCVRKIAIPRLIGTPITKAIAADVNVPAMAGQAPYWSLLTSHVELARNPAKPNSRKTGQPP